MSFHPLGSAADSHPLTAAPAELPFHHNDEDDDDWTPPALPGETRILSSSSSRADKTNGRGGAGSGGGNSSSRAPFDPLRSNPGAGAGLGKGVGAATEEESYRRAVNRNHNNNDDDRNYGATGAGQNERERRRGAGGGVIGQAAAAHGRGEEAISIERLGRLTVFSLSRGRVHTFDVGVGQLVLAVTLCSRGIQACSYITRSLVPSCAGCLLFR